MNKKIVAFALSALLVGGGSYWYLHKTPQPIQQQETVTIVNYAPEKHKSFIVGQFKENWYWLISSADYDVHYALDTHSPNTYEPQLKGKMDIVVIEEDGKPAGFATFYMRNTFTGDILFIEVAKEFRGKRLAGRLVNYAVKELKKKGAKVIRLATRVNNVKARKLYNRLKFPEVSEKNGFIHYRKQV